VVATLDTISRDALVLSPDERVALAYRLLVSVEPDESGSEQAWENEISKRIESFDLGDSKSIPAADVFARLRQIAPDK
jgi:putative addiction module component (TIGR02574 family)